MIDEEYGGAKEWSRNKQAVFTVVWISFLTAAASTMLFFALFDPVDLSGMFDDDLHLSAACAGLTAYLVRTAPRRNKKRQDK